MCQILRGVHTLRLEAQVLERGLQADEYDALIEDLHAAGWTVLEPELEEYRSIPGPDIGAAIALAIYLAKRISDTALDELVRTIIRRLRLPRKSPKIPPRECRIYGPEGETLAVVPLDQDD